MATRTKYGTKEALESAKQSSRTAVAGGTAGLPSRLSSILKAAKVSKGTIEKIEKASRDMSNRATKMRLKAKSPYNDPKTGPRLLSPRGKY